MRPGGGRQKGHNFERKVAAQFCEWWGTKVTRTPMSGGWGSSKSFETTGDLVCVGGWPFSVECKRQEGWHLEQLLTGEKSSLTKWWRQCTSDAVGVDKIPLLVFSKNHHPSFVMIRAKEWHAISPNWEPLGRLEAFMVDDASTVFILLLDEFLRMNPPDPSPNYVFSGASVKPKKKLKKKVVK